MKNAHTAEPNTKRATSRGLDDPKVGETKINHTPIPKLSKKEALNNNPTNWTLVTAVRLNKKSLFGSSMGLSATRVSPKWH